MVEDAGARRSHRRRAAAARHQPRLARAGDRRLALLRLPARPKARATPTWAGATPRCFSTCCAARALPSPTRGRCSPTRRACCASSRMREGLRERIWWGAGSNATAGLGGEARHEPAELDAEGRRDRRALPRPAGGPDPRLSCRLEGGRPHPRAARLGQPQHLRADRRSRPRLFRRASAAAKTRSASSTRRRARSSAAPMPPSRMR